MRDRIARRLVLALLKRIRYGGLVILEGPERHAFGEPTPTVSATIVVRSPAFYRALLRGSLGLCSSYMDGLWECDRLVALTRVAALNVGALDELRRHFAFVLVPVQRWGGWLARNTPRRSRRQIEAHYDLGNELFSLFLDPTMMYSCALFESPSATLEEASLAKLERVCAKLELSPADHVWVPRHDHHDLP
jgi:cyclopropane-fatty-acyl-phospholipid synthase